MTYLIGLLFGSFIVGFGFMGGVLFVVTLCGANSLIAFNSKVVVNPISKEDEAEEEKVEQS